MLSEHLSEVGRLAKKFASVFGCDVENLAEVSGLLHDLGKYTDEFQRRLTGDSLRVDHATAGAKLVVERYQSLGYLLAYAIAGHHAGLANGVNGVNRTSLEDRLKSETYRLSEAWRSELNIPKQLSLPSRFHARHDRNFFQMAFLTRMLFSCLVDADFLDTEAFYLQAEGGESPRGEYPSLADLKPALDSFLRGLNDKGKPVNWRRREILQTVRRNAELDPGLFSLTAPTGGGKTLASLAFALDHALMHKLERVIYVIPFTSIVEQNAAVFRQAFGERGEYAVLEHHSAFIEDRSKDPEAREKLKLAMENWEAPIIVTTAVQFFESLFADRPSRCRKLHNIANSVVILDEAQTLPLKLLKPCVAALDELALNYRTSIVLCTATQPALHERDNVEDSFVGGFRNVRELAPNPEQLYREFKRVSVRHIGVLDDETLTDILLERAQVLCIVNNRRHAKAVFESIRSEPGARHLSTLMCAKHRSQMLAQIREDLKQGRPCRLVSTSLIEAGVDIDFPTVLRAEAGLDSIAQAAGRCNREGMLPADECEVLVFNPANEDWAPPVELEQFASVSRGVMRHHPDPLSLAAIEEYFQHLYWRKEKELDAYDLLGLIASARITGLPFETLSSKFRLIESRQMPVIIPFDDIARKALGALDYAEGCVGISRCLQPYIVQIPQTAYQALFDAGAIVVKAEERFEQQFVYLANMDLYDEECGLSWDNPTFIRAEKLVW
ncbi:CRISPR-associated endonuclease Cas3'' [Hahella aquimaris]|uniref:CRISPR-associated endonuclease Cas3'' n=1 Tax=Hahella sp. HNIBRBA332 TaxID=3015983 RepID=UPI00273BAF9C|nr:CRISPR-associated endonuclease Cas3'' [Hahella sp. HNIBRBA332]WLQ16772.1 CRISPR-associated endonuclease Cas3'' [Hahella sp. HNIBRBA332]